MQSDKSLHAHTRATLIANTQHVKILNIIEALLLFIIHQDFMGAP
jgi:hypothetical protein